MKSADLVGKTYILHLKPKGFNLLSMIEYVGIILFRFNRFTFQSNGIVGIKPLNFFSSAFFNRVFCFKWYLVSNASQTSVLRLDFYFLNRLNISPRYDLGIVSQDLSVIRFTRHWGPFNFKYDAYLEK